MCGRYVLNLTAKDIRERFGISEFVETRVPPVAPRWNVAPSQSIPVIVEGDEGRELRPMTWGFKPAWIKGGATRPPPVNARGETLLERPMFRTSVARHRCLIPATGFYEWQASGGGKRKQPWYFAMSDGQPFGFAGLWARGADDEGTTLIITTEPNPLVARVHDRMPVVLDPDAEAAWLDPRETDPSAVLGLLAPYPADRMVGYEVSDAVNRVGNDGPELVRPLS
jgi:putative SOS response-associated peptidase YedK